MSTTNTTTISENLILIQDFLDLCQIQDNGSRRYYIRHYEKEKGEEKSIKDWEKITNLKLQKDK